MIQPGKLRHRAELQSEQETPDGAGGYELTWVTERKIWADIRAVSGVQRLESMRLESDITHEITVRYNSDVIPKKRIVYQGVDYLIRAVYDPDKLTHQMEIVASTGVPT